MVVGDYIHYHYNNYLNYGLNVNKPETISPLEELNRQRRLLLRSMPRRSNKSKTIIKQKLETSLNFYYGLRTGSVIDCGLTKQEQEEITKIIVDILLEAAKQLKIKTPGTLNLDNLDATVGDNIDTGLLSGEVSRKLKAANFNTEGQTKTTYQALYDRLKLIQNLRDQIGTQITDTPSVNFCDQVEKLNNEYSLFKRELEDMAINGGLNRTAYFSAVKGEGDSARSYGQFAKEVQDLLDQAKATTAITLKGYIGETLPIVMQEVYSAFTKGKLGELLANLRTEEGKKTYVYDIIKEKYTGYDKSIKATLGSKVLNIKNNANIQTSIQGIKINQMLTQDKVDIILQVPIYGKINTSVKNINLKSGFNIGILKGKNLINYLQDYPQFANHYLNITANKKRDGQKPGSALIGMAHDVLKLTVALHSLSGGLWGLQDKNATKAVKSPEAEIFLVNDSSGALGHYSVYFISDLMNKIMKNLDYLEIKGLDSGKEYENKWIENKQEHDKEKMTLAYARVATILAQLRTQELVVSISPRVLI